MLMVLLTLAFFHVERPTKLPLPVMPLGLAANPAESRASLETGLDAFEVRGLYARDKSNYQQWYDNDSGSEKLPTRADKKRRTTGFCDAYLERLHYLPWRQQVEKCTWETHSISNVVWYHLVREPFGDRPFYVAELDGLPHIKVQAKTIDELEKKVVERFTNLVDEHSSLELSAPSTPPGVRIYDWSDLTIPKQWKTRKPDPLDGIVAGVSFVF
jgi:hypothetical protein